jgi:hypothetical protein
MAKSILSFSESDGYIVDPVVTSFNIKRFINIIIGREPKNKVENTKRAETRQAFAALYLLGSSPKAPFGNIPCSENEIDSFLDSFDWSHPWAAGSHFSHLMFFLKKNSEFFGYKSETAQELIAYARSWVSNLQSAEDGCWYRGMDISLNQKINGAMKVLTGLHAAEIYDIDYPEKIIDTALKAANTAHACDNFNVVYALYSANILAPDYRKSEIEDFLINRLKIYAGHYHPDYGGFSFFPDRANKNYYEKIITAGENEPDIHGTAMFVWGLAIINKIMNLEINFRIPLN